VAGLYRQEGVDEFDIRGRMHLAAAVPVYYEPPIVDIFIGSAGPTPFTGNAFTPEY
jgi:hypothetical protein